MSKTEALTEALLLALTAPEGRLHEAIDLAEGLAAFCTLEEVTDAQECALDMYGNLMREDKL